MRIRLRRLHRTLLDTCSKLVPTKWHFNDLWILINQQFCTILIANVSHNDCRPDEGIRHGVHSFWAEMENARTPVENVANKFNVRRNRRCRLLMTKSTSSANAVMQIWQSHHILVAPKHRMKSKIQMNQIRTLKMRIYLMFISAMKMCSVVVTIAVADLKVNERNSISATWASRIEYSLFMSRVHLNIRYFISFSWHPTQHSAHTIHTPKHTWAAKNTHILPSTKLFIHYFMHFLFSFLLLFLPSASSVAASTSCCFSFSLVSRCQCHALTSPKLRIVTHFEHRHTPARTHHKSVLQFSFD